VRPSIRDVRFACLLAGQAVNSVGGWISAIALWGFTTYHFAASPYAVSLTIACQTAPTIVLGPFAGTVTDRLGPRIALITGYVATAAAAFGMAAAGSLAVLDVTAAWYGITRSLCGPAAGALPAAIMAPDDLLTANSLLGATGSVGQLAGPVAASAVLAVGSFHAAFFIDAITYLAGAAVIVPLPRQAPARSRPVSVHSRGRVREFVRDSGEGLSVIWRSAGLRCAVLAGIAVTITSSSYLVVEPLYARHVLRRPPSQFALFEAAAGAGAVLTGLLLPRVRKLAGAAIAARAQRRARAGRDLQRAGTAVRSMAAAGAAYGVAGAVFTGTTSVPVAYVGAFAWGCAGLTFYTLSATVIQRLSPADTRGRVFGVSSMLGSVAETGALPAGGLVLAQLGIRPGAALLAAVPVAVCGGALLLWMRQRLGVSGLVVGGAGAFGVSAGKQLGARFVVRRYRVDQLGVLGPGAAAAQRSGHPVVPLHAAAHAGSQGRQHRITGDDRHLCMESMVRQRGRAQVTGLDRGVAVRPDGPQPGHSDGIGIARRQAGRLGLQQLTHVQQLIHLGAGGHVHVGTQAGAQVDPALGFHPVQCLADGLAADPELTREVGLHQVLARLQVAAGDQVDQRVVYRLAQRYRSLNWADHRFQLRHSGSL
jgi:MFS family permease